MPIKKEEGLCPNCGVHPVFERKGKTYYRCKYCMRRAADYMRRKRAKSSGASQKESAGG